MKTAVLACLTAALSLTASPALANPTAAKAMDAEREYALARSYYEGRDGTKQDCAEAVQRWTAAAKKGHSGAMYDLGNLFLTAPKGCPASQDHPKALTWFRKAANRGDVRAMASIGVMYEGGMGVKRDGHAAFQWYLKAAHRGGVQGMVNAANTYSNGAFVERDYAKAMEWYLAAWRSMTADQAGAAIGDMHRDGLGVKKDQTEAERWYKMSGAAGAARLKGLPPCSKAEIGQACAP